MNQMELFTEVKQESPNSKHLLALNQHTPLQSNEADTLRLASLFELSVNAYYSAVYAWMSGLPIEGEIARFIEKVGAAKDRAAAERLASDRGDPDVFTVLKAANKVTREIHRIRGFLRFNQDSCGTYIARCAPDYFVLPALAEHFSLRFGETPWAIIDEKREMCLLREKGKEVLLTRLPADLSTNDPPMERPTADSWEDLWRLYHRSINNESRNNPKLQRQFMPLRYQKYLSELL